MLRESKRPFIRNLMVSAWAKKAVNPAPLCGASLGSVCRRLKSVLGAGKDLWYTAIAKNKKVSLPFFRGSKMQGSPPWNFLRANYCADLHQSASSSSSSSGIAMDRIVGAFSAPEKKQEATEPAVHIRGDDTFVSLEGRCAPIPVYHPLEAQPG